MADTTGAPAAGAAARLSLIAAPIGLGDAPLAARVSLWAGLLGAIVSRTLAHRHHRRPQGHTIPVPCIGMVRQGAVLAVVPDIGQAASITRRAAPSSGCRPGRAVRSAAAAHQHGD